MRETHQVIDMGGEKVNQVNVEFDDELEAETFFNALRLGFPSDYLKESIEWQSHFENKQKLTQMFAHIWILIKIARESDNDKVFDDHMKYNPFFKDLCQNMDVNIARLMAVLVDAAGRKRMRRVATAKEVRKRLAPYKEMLLVRCGEDFKISSLEEFPTLNTQ